MMSLLLTLMVGATMAESRDMQLALDFARQLGAIYPEHASGLGLTEFDAKATLVSAKTDVKYRTFLHEYRTRMRSRPVLAGDDVLDRQVLLSFIDRELLQISFDQSFVPFAPASEVVYGMIAMLVNPETPQARKNDAGRRFQNYVEQDAVWAWRKRTEDKAKSPLLWPHVDQVQDYLEHSSVYLDGLEELLKESSSYNPHHMVLFRKQVSQYDQFVRDFILPRARKQSLSRDLYATALRLNGVNAAPEQLKLMAKADFERMMPQFLELVNQVAREEGLDVTQANPKALFDHFRARGVRGERELMKFTQDIYRDLLDLVARHDLLTVPADPPVIRSGTEAENAASPYQHVTQSPPLAKTPHKPAYVFPVQPNGEPYDEDCSYREAAFTLTAHEILGHALQFTVLNDRGSRVRAAFGHTCATTEGWAMYIEDLLLPYLPARERLGAMQSILFRVARAFLDPMVQLEQLSEAEVRKLLVEDLGLAESFVAGEYSRYAWRLVGQAPSYYWGLRAFKDLKQNVKASRAHAFNERAFNDALLEGGPMPFDLCERHLMTTLPEQPQTSSL